MMTLPSIFCPQCHHLILDANQCSACHWSRPIATGEIGQPDWAVALEVKLPRQGIRPTVLGSYVYYPTDKGQIVALNTTETEAEQAIKWRHQLGANYHCHGLTVWDEYLLIGYEYTGGFPAPHSELICLSAKSGDVAWRHPVDGASLSVSVVHQGVAYFTVNTGWLYAIDLTTRQELWRHKIGSPWSWAPAAPLLTPSGLLILPGRCNELVAFHLENREMAWTFSGEGWFPPTPVWQEGMVYVRCWDRHVYALDAASGQIVWQLKAPRDFSSDLWVNEKYLYIGVKDYRGSGKSSGRAYALYTLDRHTGDRIGRYEVPGHVNARPVATEEMVFFATDDRSRQIDSQGTLYALDVEGQQVLWEPCIVDQRFQSDLVLVGDQIIAGTRQGVVYAVRWREVATVETPQFYLKRQEWESAAIAFAWQGEYSQAAEIYERKLGQKRQAGQLYLHAGEHLRVLELLGQSEVEAERDLAIEAAQLISKADERAQALLGLGEYVAAAEAFVEVEDWEKAGDCYQAAQAWPEARAAYAYVEAWDKWEKLTRELKLWDELIDRMLSVGEYEQAALVYADRGLFLNAAECYEQASRPAEALEAYRRISPDKLGVQEQRRLAELAQQLGEPETAVDAYQAIGELAKAAEVADSFGQYNQALVLYRDLDDKLKVAEMLEKLARYVEAAEIFEQERKEGRAAENWERQVDQKIEQLGGVRYAHKNTEIESWLKRAIDLFEDEENFAKTAADRRYYNRGAERCRNKLTQIRREPLLQVSFQTDSLIVGQGSVVRCFVKNIGWGTARQPVLYLTSHDLEHQLDPIPLPSLKRNQQIERELALIPKVGGAITLQIRFQGQSKQGELSELRIEGSSFMILRPEDRAEEQAVPSQPITETDWGAMWEESEPKSSGETDTGIISRAELRHQRIKSLRRELTRRSSNLYYLREQAARYGAGQIPLVLRNDVDDEAKAIAKIELKLAELQAEDKDD